MAEGRSRIWIWFLVGGGLFALFVVGVFTLVYLSFGGGDEETFTGFGSKIAVVELDGVIFSPKQIVPQLKKFADDDSVKAIIIHVNSPGGGVAASEEIYREVKRIRDEKKKRIVASIETVGASGAYYVASATNKIYADKGSDAKQLDATVDQYMTTFRSTTKDWLKAVALAENPDRFVHRRSKYQRLTGKLR